MLITQGSLVRVQPCPPLLFGDIAQLGERCPCKAEVSGSNPLISTNIVIVKFIAYVLLKIPYLSSLLKVDTLFVVQIGRRKDIKSINLTMMIKKQTSL